jgi:hypothetical protein
VTNGIIPRNIVSTDWRRIVMSTLEKTIDILSVLPEKQIEIVYSYVQFIHSQQMDREQRSGSGSVNDILDSLAGALPDSGKTLEQYHEERIRERYEVAD